MWIAILVIVGVAVWYSVSYLSVKPTRGAGGYIPIVSVDPPSSPSDSSWKGKVHFKYDGPAGDSDVVAVAWVASDTTRPDVTGAYLDSAATHNLPTDAKSSQVVGSRVGNQSETTPTGVKQYWETYNVTAPTKSGNYLVVVTVTELSTGQMHTKYSEVVTKP